MRVPGKPRRIELDFVRGCGILLVMMDHFRVPNTGVWVLDGFREFILFAGEQSMTVFFVLSGFLVGGLLMKEYRDTHRVHAGRFLLRRMFKIWPSYYVLLLVHLAIRRHPWQTFLWQNALNVQNYFGSSILQTWSLAVEEHFYLMLPLLMLFIASRRWSARSMLLLFGGINAAAFLWRFYAVRRLGHYANFHQTQYNIDSILLGVILAVLFYFLPEVYAKLSRRAWPLILIVAAGEFLTAMPSGIWAEPFLHVIGYFTCGAILLLAVEHSGRMTRTWPYRAVATAGIYSYGIYLYHSVMLTVGDRIIARYPPVAAYFVGWAAQMSGALVLGYAMTRIVEWPFLLWRERIPTLRDREPLMVPVNEGDADGIVQTV